MTNANELTKGYRVMTDVVQDEYGKLTRKQVKQVLFLRADAVVKRLQEHNDRMQKIAERVAEIVKRNTMLDRAASIISRMECRCLYIGDGDTMCPRCQWLDDLKRTNMANTKENSSD